MSAPELEQPVPMQPKRGRTTWLVALLAGLVVVGLVVSLTGAWRAFLPEAADARVQTLELPDVPADGSFGAQQPKWTDCGDGFECADVRAPLDWERQDGETITLRMVKHPADNGNPMGTLFVNPGGPGASGADYVRDSLDYAVGADLRERYDVVGWDPRGVGASTPVRCLDNAEMDDYLYGLPESTHQKGSDAWIEEVIADGKEYGDTCLEKNGELLAHVDTGSTVRDLDMLREIVGDEQLTYLGYSYGTYIGSRYADAYPERVGRLVLDGVLEPAASETEVVREQTRGFELALRNYVTACLETSDCPFEGDDVDAAMAQIGSLLNAVDRKPLTGSDGRAVTSSTFLTAIIMPLYSEDNWGYLNRLFESVEVGDADIALILADAYNGRTEDGYLTNSTEAFHAINCLDYPSEIDPAQMRRDAAELKRIAPTIGRFQGFGELSCAGWPFPGVSERTGVTGAGADPILVIGTTGDPATPFRWAESLADQLESAVLLRYDGEGHTAYGEDDCVNRVVEAYLIDGVVPEAGLSCGAQR